MFTNSLSNITLANDVADRFFNNITASAYGTDKTFAATLRAMLHKRLPVNETMKLSYVWLEYDTNYLVDASTETIMKGITRSINQADTYDDYAILVAYTVDKEAGAKVLEIIRNNAGKNKRYFDTYEQREDLRVFYVRMLNALFYTNEQRTIIFVDHLDFRNLHALQMMIPRYLDKLFRDNPLSDNESELLKSLGLKTSSKYELLIEQFANQFDMRNEMIRVRLKGFESVYERRRIEQLEQNIDRYQQEYESLLTSLREKLRILEEQRITLAGLQSLTRADENDSELMEYFICNKHLSLMNVSGTQIEFVVHGYADIYDQDAFDTYVSNPDSYLYEEIYFPRKNMELLYRALFGSRKYKLRMCAAYTVDMKNAITPIRDYDFPQESRDYLPNPHIQDYGCIGGYALRFTEYMQNRDYVGAIDQAVVSARNINFHDSPVIRTFASTLSSTLIRCIEDADGNLYTPAEVVRRLENNMEEAA